MKDQQNMWNSFHTTSTVGDTHISLFAQEVLDLTPPKSKILELGCGGGYDAAAFAMNGHLVTATVFSKDAIKENSEKFKKISNLEFLEMDISQKLPYEKSSFDVVYARLSLHYFTDEVTREIFKEIHRVLKKDGYLCFMCKSTNDILYGQGIEIQKDMYDRGGHIRHFMSVEYARSCTANLFRIDSIEEGKFDNPKNTSTFVKVVATVL